MNHYESPQPEKNSKTDIKTIVLVIAIVLEVLLLIYVIFS